MDLGLYTTELTVSKTLQIFNKIHPRIGGELALNLELELTFLDFIEALSYCAEASVLTPKGIKSTDGVETALSENVRISEEKIIVNSAKSSLNLSKDETVVSQKSVKLQSSAGIVGAHQRGRSSGRSKVSSTKSSPRKCSAHKLIKQPTGSISKLPKTKVEILLDTSEALPVDIEPTEREHPLTEIGLISNQNNSDETVLPGEELETPLVPSIDCFIIEHLIQSWDKWYRLWEISYQLAKQ